jgi:hypothetical protein
VKSQRQYINVNTDHLNVIPLWYSEAVPQFRVSARSARAPPSGFV